ncbi:hypothetical protein M9H77_02072 [Catharanthus roseus]|uniref:Uncharacterized protein n=1 Tax=Catharanthus roseus TaxID=4058 RepID=A0ACC0C7I5_CATRO|nr:hypothetical protein M9H77_02072 [Catharanthus roseus]
MGIGNLTSRAKTFDHIPYDDCCEKSPYNVHKEYHGSHDYNYPSCGREVNYEGLIGENDYAKFGNDGSFYFYLPSKDVSECAFFNECRGFNDFENLVTTSSFVCELFEGMDMRLNPFKERRYGMTGDKHENMKIFQGSTTTSRSRKLDGEHEEIVAFPGRTVRIIRGRNCKGENEDQRSTKAFLISIMQVEKAKGTSLEDLEDSTSNRK